MPKHIELLKELDLINRIQDWGHQSPLLEARRNKVTSDLEIELAQLSDQDKPTAHTSTMNQG